METTFVLNKKEIDTNFLGLVKKMFHGKDFLKVHFSNADEYGLLKKETKKEYWDRINRNIEEINNKKNTITLTQKEFKDFTKKILK
jgi:hypothetical protein